MAEMSTLRQQRPEHLVIREYVRELLQRKIITQEGLRDAFVAVYIEMIPPGDAAPEFEPVHIHDDIDVMRKKDTANLKKLWRAIDGVTFFPLCFRAPLIAALESLGESLGNALDSRLLHNAGLHFVPIDTTPGAALYAELLDRFAKANKAMVDDLGDDGIFNGPETLERVLDSIDQQLALARELQKNLYGKDAAPD